MTDIMPAPHAGADLAGQEATPEPRRPSTR